MGIFVTSCMNHWYTGKCSWNSLDRGMLCSLLRSLSLLPSVRQVLLKKLLLQIILSCNKLWRTQMQRIDRLKALFLMNWTDIKSAWGVYILGSSLLDATEVSKWADRKQVQKSRTLKNWAKSNTSNQEHRIKMMNQWEKYNGKNSTKLKIQHIEKDL